MRTIDAVHLGLMLAALAHYVCAAVRCCSFCPMRCSDRRITSPRYPGCTTAAIFCPIALSHLVLVAQAGDEARLISNEPMGRRRHLERLCLRAAILATVKSPLPPPVGPSVAALAAAATAVIDAAGLCGFVARGAGGYSCRPSSMSHLHVDVHDPGRAAVTQCAQSCWSGICRRDRADPGRAAARQGRRSRRSPDGAGVFRRRGPAMAGGGVRPAIRRPDHRPALVCVHVSLPELVHQSRRDQLGPIPARGWRSSRRRARRPRRSISTVTRSAWRCCSPQPRPCAAGIPAQQPRAPAARRSRRPRFCAALAPAGLRAGVNQRCCFRRSRSCSISRLRVRSLLGKGKDTGPKPDDNAGHTDLLREEPT